jgi:hypothetical protein
MAAAATGKTAMAVATKVAFAAVAIVASAAIIIVSYMGRSGDTPGSSVSRILMDVESSDPTFAPVALTPANPSSPLSFGTAEGPIIISSAAPTSHPSSDVPSTGFTRTTSQASKSLLSGPAIGPTGGTTISRSGQINFSSSSDVRRSPTSEPTSAPTGAGQDSNPISLGTDRRTRSPTRGPTSEPNSVTTTRSPTNVLDGVLTSVVTGKERTNSPTSLASGSPTNGPYMTLCASPSSFPSTTESGSPSRFPSVDLPLVQQALRELVHHRVVWIVF